MAVKWSPQDVIDSFAPYLQVTLEAEKQVKNANNATQPKTTANVLPKIDPNQIGGQV